MINQLKYLITLQDLDSKILTIKSKLDEIPTRLEKADLLLRESQGSYNIIKKQLDELEKKKRAKEKELEVINDKIQKLKNRTSEIKTNKEYQAHLKEIENVEKERSDIEDEILNIMIDIDSVTKQLKDEEKKLNLEKEKIKNVKEQIQKEKQDMEYELSNVKTSRNELMEKIDQELYEQYINLLETCNGLAVTEAINEVCQGCNMNIPPQLFVELKKNENIITCPQCHRILYYKNRLSPQNDTPNTN
jgi:predicted  nucleic acid-binding Zn-ribbon protein